MASDISVSIGLTGESKFKAALKECQNSIKQIDSALKANAAEYEANAEALGDNAERTQLLKQAIETQKKLFNEMGEAVEYAGKEYGAASEQATRYVVAQNKAREAIAKLEKELKDTDREMEELGRDSIKVGRQIESGIGDAAEDAAKNLDDMYGELKTEIENIGGMMGVELFGDIASGLGDLATGVYDFVEGTREYRRMQSYLISNAISEGLQEEEVENILYRIGAITGDMEGAYEAMNNLINAGFDITEIAQAADLLISAALKWPGVLDIGSLAESLQETISTKSAVGQYAELLERMGVDLNAVNEALKQTTTQEAAQTVALSFLANRGLEQQLAEYEQLNKMMIESETATLQLKAAWAMLGGTIEKWVTPIINAVTATIEAIDDVLSGRAFEKTREENAAVQEEIDERTELYTQLADVNKLIEQADLEGNQKEAERLEKVRSDVIAAIADYARGMYAEEEAESVGEEAGKVVAEGMAKGMVEGFDGLMSSALGDLWTGKEYDPMAYFATLEPTEAELNQAKLFGEEAANAETEGMISAIKEAETALETAMENSMIAMANGVTDGGQSAYDNLTDLVAAMQEQINSFTTQPMIDELNRLAGLTMSTPTTQTVPGRNAVNVRETSSTGGAMNISFNVGGRKFWTAQIKDLNAVQGRTIELI